MQLADVKAFEPTWGTLKKISASDSASSQQIAAAKVDGQKLLDRRRILIWNVSEDAVLIIKWGDGTVAATLTDGVQVPPGGFTSFTIGEATHLSYICEATATANFWVCVGFGS